jgi:general stress protein 26
MATMNQAERDHFRTLLKSYSNAMLVTCAKENGDLHGRPMALAEATDNGELWFVSEVESKKIAEIASDPRVGVIMQSDMSWISVSGEAHIVRDRERVKALWQEQWRVWFPKGADDTDLVLVHVKPHRAEYWDNRGQKGLRFLFDAARHYLQGKKKEGVEEPEQHGTVDL